MRGEFLAWTIRGAGLAVGVAVVLGIVALGRSGDRSVRVGGAAVTGFGLQVMPDD